MNQMSTWMYLLLIIGFLFPSPHSLSGASSSDDHETSDQEASDHEAPDNEASDHGPKKGRSRKKDLPEHHPPHGVRFDILWEDGELVYDGVARNLFHKLARIASNWSLFPMDVPWNHQNKQSIHDAIGSIKVI